MMGAPNEDLSRLDGNAAAGLLREIFALEMTTAHCTCAECGAVWSVGALHLYGGGMGSVLRCASCEAVVLCIASGPAGYFIELRGLMRIRWAEGHSQVAPSARR